MSDLDFKTDFSSELATIITLLENIYIAQKRAGSNVANEPDFDKARAELAELREDRERLERRPAMKIKVEFTFENPVFSGMSIGEIQTYLNNNLRAFIIDADGYRVFAVDMDDEEAPDVLE